MTPFGTAIASTVAHLWCFTMLLT